MLEAMRKADKIINAWGTGFYQPETYMRRVSDSKHYRKEDRLIYAMMLTAWGL